MPKVLNKRTDTIPPDAVYVGRPSKWGNPFMIGHSYGGWDYMTREQVISQHTDWLLYSDQGIELQLSIFDLRGKDLVCYCAPLPCHADILLGLANGA